jgi:hypothetical protein
MYAGFHSKLAAQLADWSTLQGTKIATFCAHYRAVSQTGHSVTSCE